MLPKEFEILYETIVNPLKDAGATVWIFGSRARGDHKKNSDVDILYEFPANAKIPSGLIFSVKEELDDSRFPFIVDLVALKDLAKSYSSGVLTDRKLL